MNQNINKIFTVVLLLIIAFNIKAQDDWNVPASEKTKVNPLPFNTKTKMHGKDIFLKNCKSCHGDVGKANFLPLTPPPGDPANEKFSKNTDGELFYKITNGKGAMPRFKDQLSENDRWAVIAYIRSFHKDYKPASTSDAGTDDTEVFSGTNLKINLNLDNNNHTVIANVTGDKDGNNVPANGVRVNFYIKRNFGLLPVCETVSTDNNGIATAKYPTDLPGDSLGNYQIVVKLVDNDMYGDVVAQQKVQWGKQFIWENPLDKRALWNTRAKVPIALITAYLFSVIAVLIVLAWVALQIKKIAKLGK